MISPSVAVRRQIIRRMDRDILCARITSAKERTWVVRDDRFACLSSLIEVKGKCPVGGKK